MTTILLSVKGRITNKYLQFLFMLNTGHPKISVLDMTDSYCLKYFPTFSVLVFLRSIYFIRCCSVIVNFFTLYVISYFWSLMISSYYFPYYFKHFKRNPSISPYCRIAGALIPCRVRESHRIRRILACDPALVKYRVLCA